MIFIIGSMPKILAGWPGLKTGNLLAPPALLTGWKPYRSASFQKTALFRIPTPPTLFQHLIWKNKAFLFLIKLLIFHGSSEAFALSPFYFML